MNTRTGLRPGPNHQTVRDESGSLLPIPVGWELLPPGDAGLTRAVKALGPSWAVEEKRGRKSFSRGIWAPAEHIRAARASLGERRADPAYARQLEAGRARRSLEQERYVEEFEREVLLFLRFHADHAALAAELALRVTAHATPVGSGTVARTERIDVEHRAEAAVIAWMRHQTTSYDDRVVVRVAGARRELRRELADASRAVLSRYRRGLPVTEDCPLARALGRPVEGGVSRPVAPVAPVGRATMGAARSAPLGVRMERPAAPAPTLRAPGSAGAVRAAPAGAARAPATRSAQAGAARAPVDPARQVTTVAPKTAAEEAQQARYLAVRTRLMKGR